METRAYDFWENVTLVSANCLQMKLTLEVGTNFINVNDFPGPVFQTTISANTKIKF